MATLLAVLVAGCQVEPSPVATARAAPTIDSATLTPAPSEGAAETAIAANDVADSTGELAPGRYTWREFEPRVTFELDGPWHAVELFRNFFDVQQDVGSPDVISVHFGLPDQVAASPDDAAAITSAEQAVSTLRSNTRLVVVESSAARIGGLTGFQVTVENPAKAADLTPVVRVTPGVLQISPGRRLLCAFFDTPQGVLAIMVGGSVEKWDAALAAAEPVLQSVTIGR